MCAPPSGTHINDRMAFERLGEAFNILNH